MSTTSGDVITDLSGGRPVGVGGWIVVHEPGAAAQATVTKAAGAAGVKHVCTGIVATVAAAGTAQTPVAVELVDGSTVILAAQLAAPINTCATLFLSGLAIEGTAATGMTLRFSAAGVAGSFEAVTLIGYDVS
jgi:hypothetical protein